MKVDRVLTIIFFIFLLSCNMSYETNLKNQTDKLELIISELSESDYDQTEESLIMSNHDAISLKKSLDLCSVEKHSFGISFRFKCDKLLGKKSNYTDKEYYLIKLLDLSSKESLQGYERWADCSTEPEELNDNWFYIKRHLRCD